MKTSSVLVTLTYSPDSPPASQEDAKREIQNFLRRVKRFRKRQNLPELKYVAVIKTNSGGHIYHQVVMNGGVDPHCIKKLWGKGLVASKPLQLNADIFDLAMFLTAQNYFGRWCASRSLGGSGNKPRSMESALEGFFPGVILHEKAYKRSVKNDREAG